MRAFFSVTSQKWSYILTKTKKNKYLYFTLDLKNHASYRLPADS